MKIIGIITLGIVALLAIGSVVAPFAALAWFLSAFTLSQIVKGLIIAYVCLIPVSIFARPY